MPGISKTESREDLISDLQTRLARLDEHENAIRQLEDDRRSIMNTMDQRLRTLRSSLHDPRVPSRYRGLAWDSPDEARAFGLYALSRTAELGSGVRERCADALKSEYPEIGRRAMASDPNDSGGATVPQEFSARLVRLVENFGVFESNAFIMPMNSDNLVFIRRKGGLTVYLVGENTAGTESKPDFGNVSLAAREWGTLTYYPQTLAEDAEGAAIELGEFLALEIAQAMAEKTDQIGFNGNGTSTYFGVNGVIPRLKSINGVDDGGGLVLGSGNLWSELTLPDHEKLMGALPQYAANGAAWYCSRAYFFNVMVKLATSAGGVTAGEIEGRRRLMFGGDPVNITQVIPTSEANSQIPVIYGNLRLAATVGRRREMTVAQSEHYKFGERQVTVLGTQRKAISVHELGDDETAGPVVGLITASS